jgi:hypothetical protein
LLESTIVYDGYKLVIDDMANYYNQPLAVLLFLLLLVDWGVGPLKWYLPSA